MAYVANKQNTAQLTNVHYWDSAGAAWSGNLIGAGLPFAFLPNPVVAADLVLFGIDSTILNSGPFCSLVFDILTAQTGITGITWRYSDVAGADPTTWAALNVVDNTDQDGAMTGVAFDTAGINSVHWLQNSLWIVQNPTIGGVALGVTGLWVCAHVTAAAAATPPIQQNRDVYTITWSGMSISEAGGDMDAWMNFQLNGESYRSVGPGSPKIMTDRAILGLRSVDRGSAFVPYFNLGNVQNPTGVTITANAVDTAFAADITSPSGMAAVYNPGANRAFAIEVSVRLQGTALSHSWGKFRCFLRAQQTGGAAGDIGARIKVGPALSDDRTTFSGREAYLQAVAVRESLDLGSITIPPMNADPGTAYNIMFLIIELNNSNFGVATLALYDLIIIPVDEWSLDTYDPFEVGYTSEAWISNIGYLDVTSLYPKRVILSTLRNAAGQIESSYRTITPGPAILHPDKDQVIWGHFSYVDYLIVFPPRKAPHEIAHSVDVSKLVRYSSMRGDR